MAETEESPKSALAQAIEATKPKAYPFTVHGLLGLGKKPVHKVAIHALRKAEEEGALKDAHRRVEQFAEDIDSLKGDDDLMNDAKAMAIIQKGVRTEDNSMEAFYGVAWMRENFTGDHVGQLMNLVNEVRMKESGIQWDFSTDRVNAITQLCVRAAQTEIPERVLSAYQREYLSSLVVLLALRLYKFERPGVEVVRDEETGKYKIQYPEGDGPEWEALPDGWIDDPELDGDIADAIAEDHERVPD